MGVDESGVEGLFGVDGRDGDGEDGGGGFSEFWKVVGGYGKSE